MNFQNNYQPVNKYRQKILDALLKSGLILSSVALVPSMIVSIIHSKLYIGIVNTLFAILFVSLSYFSKLSYKIKSAVILIIIYITAVNVLMNYGFISGAPAWFFSVAVIAALLLGIKAAVVSVIATSLTLIIAGYIINLQIFDSFPFFISTTHAYAALGNYILLNGTASVTVAVLLNRLEGSEYQYRIITGNIEEIIWIIDNSMSVTYMNPSVRNITGKGAEFFLNRSIRDFIDSDELVSEISDILGNKKSTSHLELEYRNFQNENFILEINIAGNDEKKGKSITGIIRNITERKKAQQQIVQNRKMDAVGELAGSVAHELNNILSGIVGYPDLMLMEMKKSSKYYSFISEIKKAGERAAEIIQDLLIMTKKGIFHIEPLYINEEILAAVNTDIFQNLKKDHPEITLIPELDSNNPLISCSKIHLKKSISNLIINAYDSISGTGEVRIKTESIILEHSCPSRFCTVPEGEYCLFSVTDNGTGINETDIEHIFEPFYTKKMLKKQGTGLGMTVVWGTIKECGAFIDIKSAQGNGTSIYLFFPLIKMKREKQKEPVFMDLLKGNREKILVVCC